MKKDFISKRHLGFQFNEPNEQGWHADTNLGCEVKTLLHSDKRMVVGKEYPGIFRYDSNSVVNEFLSSDPHYTFLEMTTSWIGKRNLRIFNGRFISVTCSDNGSLRFNFKRINFGVGLPVKEFALGVANEIQQALNGLIKK